MVCIYLFHAEWCGHCKKFIPDWEKIKRWCVENGIDTKECEDSEFQQMKSNPARNEYGDLLDDVDGYPTIIITSGGGNKIIVQDRNMKSIISQLKEAKSGNDTKKIQTGGSGNPEETPTISIHSDQDDTNNINDMYGGENENSIYYRDRYLKYKRKYNELKKTLGKM